MRRAREYPHGFMVPADRFVAELYECTCPFCGGSGVEVNGVAIVCCDCGTDRKDATAALANAFGRTRQ